MTFTDTHTHLYLDQFNKDRDEVIKSAIDKGTEYMLLPNIDNGTTDKMLEVCGRYPDNCYPMMGLHPTSVKGNYLEELRHVEEQLQKNKFIAIGEIGIDLYWDKTFLEQQKQALMFQSDLALQYDLPIVIHQRDSYSEIMKVFDEINEPELRGVFHCFTGNLKQAREIIDMGFMLGIGGVLTFKNSGLADVIKDISLEHILLETDAPFLAPHPYRGKRNESAYIRLIARKIADIKNMEIEEVATATTENAVKLFKFV